MSFENNLFVRQVKFPDKTLLSMTWDFYNIIISVILIRFSSQNPICQKLRSHKHLIHNCNINLHRTLQATNILFHYQSIGKRDTKSYLYYPLHPYLFLWIFVKTIWICAHLQLFSEIFCLKEKPDEVDSILFLFHVKEMRHKEIHTALQAKEMLS